MPTKTQTRKTATDPDPLRDIPEAALALRLSTATIRSWVSQRRIESIRVGRLVRIRQSAIDAVIAAGTIPADSRIAVT